MNYQHSEIYIDFLTTNEILALIKLNTNLMNNVRIFNICFNFWG